MKAILQLFKFMTRFPIPFDIEFDSDNLGKGIRFFPLVGLIIGIILFLVSGILYSYTSFSATVIAIIVVILEVIFTGGLHLDGLADTFDGIFSYRSKQKMLDIMKDSRLGANGGMVLILYFMLKTIFVAELLGEKAFFVILLYPIFSRFNSVINCFCENYAKSAGMGKTFCDNTKFPDLIISFIITILIIIGAYFYIPNILNIEPVIFVFIITSFLGWGFGKLMTKKIGGITGDTLGAVVELSEIVVLFLFYFSFNG